MAIKKISEGDFEGELNKGALWAVTYGDLMSYLMIFFLIMFAFSIGKRGPGSESRQADESLASIQKVFGGKVDPKRQKRAEQRQQEEQVAQKLEAQIQSKNLSAVVEVKANEERVQIVLKEAVLFDSGHAELKQKANDVLASVADSLRTVDNDIVIEGHTDNVPIRGGKYASNFELSQGRAYAVVKYFLELGMDPKRLVASGYGEYRPVADNKSAEARAKNRRIEISIIRTK